MTNEEIAASIRAYEVEIESLKRRISEVEALTRSINELAGSVKELAVTVSNNNERMNSYEDRLKHQGERIGDLEKNPAKKWENLSGVIVAAMASGIVGFMLSNIL